MKKKNPIIFIAVSVVVLVIAGLIFWNVQKAKAAAAQGAMQVEAVSRGDLVDIIGGTGSVHSKQSSTLTWQTSGVVEEVFVTEGEPVEVDQPLSNLDSQSLAQNVIQSQADLINYQQELSDLYANADLEYADAQLAVFEAQETLEDLQDDRVWLDYPRCDQDTIDDYWNQYQSASDRVKDIEGVYDGSNSSMLDMLIEARRTRDTAYANYSYCSLPRSDSELARADAEILQAQANLDNAQAKVDRMTPDSPDPNDVAALEAKIDATEAIIGMAELTSPFAGQVTEVLVQPGDQVASGSSAFRIDDLSQLLVDVEVSEVDINRIEEDQPATLTFDAIFGKEYHGVVSDIDSVGTSDQGVVEFTVTIRISDPDEDIKPGMTAVVNITVNELENVILIPNQAVRVVDEERVVYVQKFDGSLEAVPVELGISSGSYSQVLSGDLETGDMVVLDPPDDVLMIGGGGGMGVFVGSSE